MPTGDPEKAVLAFIERINAHDVPGLCALMAENHVFVDSDGSRVAGREAMRAGWAKYLEWFPDYHIAREEMLSQGDVVAIFGTARGTYAGDGRQAERKPWEIPAAWKAVVREGHVVEWRVYANVDAVRKQMEEGAR
jgi:ketosteroid isomerase-like protein